MLDATIKAYATRHLGALALAGVLALSLAGSRLDARPNAAPPGKISGFATVIDGDTLSIGETRIRLEGIDAPEAAQSCGRRWFGTWACGQVAADELAKLTARQTVTCANKGIDKYDRMLGICFVNGADINAEMVRRGFAWAFVKYSTTYTAVEGEAKARKAGIWQGDAQPPWEFRHSRWTSVETSAPAGCAIKGNVTKNGRIYHMPWSPWYDQIKIETDKGKRWFCSEAEAVAAGWRPVQVH
ncbi:MAG: thermonuclease family protein [Hyphomicrobiaceae bacterium]